MYVKTTVRKTKTGEVRYLQLAHSEWDAAARRSVPKVVYSFGREDQLDTDAIRGSLPRCPGCSAPVTRWPPPPMAACVHRVPALRRRVRP